jgi:hypothetical protein
MGNKIKIKIDLTYKTIIEEHNFFKDILSHIEEVAKATNDNKINIISLINYEKILEEYLDGYYLNNSRKYESIKNTLSYENLRSHNLIRTTHTDSYNITHINIASHVVEMLENIHKEFHKPITSAHYNNFVTQIDSYKKQFSDSSLHKSQDLSNLITALYDTLEDIYNKISSSVESLRYQKNNLSKKNLDDDLSIELKRLKIKQVNKIRTVYIDSLYSFLNKNNKFVMDIIGLRNILEARDKLLNVTQKLDFYLTSYLLLIEPVKEIRSYFTKYIQQSEKELLRNLGNDYYFNLFMNIYKNTLDGRKTGFKILNQTNELKRINPFFKSEEVFSKKPTLIKTNDYDDKVFMEYFIYMSEVDTNKNILKHQHILENKHAEVENKQRAIIKANNLLFNASFNNFKIHIEKQNIYDVEITDIVKKFIIDNQLKINRGEFQFFVSYIVKKYNTKKRINKFSEKTSFTDFEDNTIYFNKLSILS